MSIIKQSALCGSKVNSLWNTVNGRYISTINHLLLKSHYDSLGLTPRATQTDIKSAYYKMSKLYHPDKNKGSKEAAIKFHEITAAYEVLGNYKLRKLYDKGIIHSADQIQPDNEPVEDDPQTKFYKQHMRKSEKPHASGRTPIYDFDEWSRNHYGAAFNRNQQGRLKHHSKISKEQTEREISEKHNFVFLLLIFTITFTYFYYQESKLDSPLLKKPSPTPPPTPNSDPKS